MAMFQFERDGEVVQLDPPGRVVVRPAAALDLSMSAALAGLGVIQMFETMLRPYFESGALEPVLQSWWPTFSGPFLYYPGRRHVPAPLRAFINFVKADPMHTQSGPQT